MNLVLWGGILRPPSLHEALSIDNRLFGKSTITAMITTNNEQPGERGRKSSFRECVNSTWVVRIGCGNCVWVVRI